MRARVKRFEVEFEPMTKFEYYDKIRKLQIQHAENKWVKGYYVDWNGYKFWLPEEDFNKLYEVV